MVLFKTRRFQFRAYKLKHIDGYRPFGFLRVAAVSEDTHKESKSERVLAFWWFAFAIGYTAKEPTQ